MKFTPNVALVKSLFTNDTHLLPVVEAGKTNARMTVPGAQIMVVRYDQDAQDLIYQVFSIGWRFKGDTLEQAKNLVLFRGFANPFNLTVGARLCRSVLASQADNKASDRICNALRAHLRVIQGEAPIPDTDFAKPMAYHPKGLVSMTDFRGTPQVLNTRMIEGADQWGFQVPESLPGWVVAEALHQVSVQHVKVDMSNLTSWRAIPTELLQQTQIKIDMLVSASRAQEIFRLSEEHRTNARARKEQLEQARAKAHAEAREAAQAAEKAAARAKALKEPAPQDTDSREFQAVPVSTQEDALVETTPY